MKKELVICIDNEGYQQSLAKRKLYIRLEDPEAATRDQIRVIDESGEDHVFPARCFVTVVLPPETEQAVIAAA